MIKYCIFDLDGTLLNTLPTIKHHLNNTLLSMGLEPVDDSETKRYIGDGAYQLVFRALSDRGITDESTVLCALADYKAAYDDGPLYLTEIYDGIEELLAGLKKQGIITLVLSNKPDLAARTVVKHFFGDAFYLVRGGIDGIALKPDPVAALSMLRELGASPEECAFVGDTSVDIATGRNMGAALSIGVLWGFREEAELVNAGADAIVSRPEDIIAVLGGESED